MLDDFIRKYASQNQRLGYSRTYVAVRTDGSHRVDAYYSLSMASITFAHLPEALTKRAPRYPMPVAHLGRLAVDQVSQKQGLGRLLLMDAIGRVLMASQIVAARAIDVVAIDDEAKSWYEGYGFQPFLDSPMHLFLPIDTAHQALKR